MGSDHYYSSGVFMDVCQHLLILPGFCLMPGTTVWSLSVSLLSLSSLFSPPPFSSYVFSALLQ